MKLSKATSKKFDEKWQYGVEGGGWSEFQCNECGQAHDVDLVKQFLAQVEQEAELRGEARGREMALDEVETKVIGKDEVVFKIPSQPVSPHMKLVLRNKLRAGQRLILNKLKPTK